ncbi:MAG: hypothetical protein ABI647_13450 [Gemmatimonadota bacterium]
MSTGALHFLRLIHIVVGVFWVGSVLFLTLYLIPTVQALGPAAGPFMDHLTRVRKLPFGLVLATLLTLASGILLVWLDSAHFQAAWFRSGPGMTFTTGGTLALVSGFLGFLVSSPTARRLGTLAAATRAAGQPTPEQVQEIQRLQARLGKVGILNAVLLLLATAAMATARYVG